MLTDSEKCELQDIAYIPKVAAAPILPNKSELRELIKIGYIQFIVPNLPLTFTTFTIAFAEQQKLDYCRTIMQYFTALDRNAKYPS